MLTTPFEKVSAQFDKLLQSQPRHSAAQVAVRWQGSPVVDLAGSRDSTRAVNTETPFLAFSISKAFTAVAILRLMEEGRLELDEPVACYWPEFARGGKQSATIRHALLHQAGIPAPHLNRQVFSWPFWGLVTRGVANEPAVFPPGTQTAYHLVNFGFILGEVVRRVSGLPVDRYLHKNFFEPMGLKNTRMRITWNTLPRTPQLLTVSPSMRTNVRLFNLPIIRTALLPAAGLHSTARELAAFFQMLLDGGAYQEQRYLKPETVALATRSHYDGYDSYIKGNMNWGLGFIMGGGSMRNPDPYQRVMGHGSSTATFSAMGMGTCMVWADRRAGLITAFTTNAMLAEPEVSQRWAQVSNAVWDCLPS
jgi:CubicO group peptidase (beta-lactamase class C family)